jgi:hypothetical protein
MSLCIYYESIKRELKRRPIFSGIYDLGFLFLEKSKKSFCLRTHGVKEGLAHGKRKIMNLEGAPTDKE